MAMTPTIQNATLENDRQPEPKSLSAEWMLRGSVITALLWAMLLLLFV
jgi:hypothetical protein